MLADQELATIRAALRFWNDEIVTSGQETARLYSDSTVDPQLSDAGIRQLIESFTDANVRYLVVRNQTPVSPLLALPRAELHDGETCVSVILAAQSLMQR
jgi:hypothetical protein